MNIADLMSDIKHLSDEILENQAMGSMNKTAPNGIVRVYVRTNYGTKHYYPANRPAELFLAVQGGKVLTAQTLRTLKAEGYEIEYRYDEEKL
jgi:hypothetical protein